jgi:phosphoribosylanthranilate isomerase
MKVFKFKKRKKYPEVTLRTIIKGYDITPEQFKWIAVHQKLSETFIEEYIDRFNLEDVYKHHFMSEAFIEKHIDRCTKAVWKIISINQQLSEQFIEKHIDKLDWYEMSFHQNLSQEFVKKYADRIYWPEFLTKKYISEENVREVVSYLDKDAILAIFKRKYISKEFIEENIEKLNLARKYRILFHMIDNYYPSEKIDIIKRSIGDDDYTKKRSH